MEKMDTVTYIKYLGIFFKKCVAHRIKIEPYLRVFNSSRVNFVDKFVFLEVFKNRDKNKCISEWKRVF